MNDYSIDLNLSSQEQQFMLMLDGIERGPGGRGNTIAEEGASIKPSLILTDGIKKQFPPHNGYPGVEVAIKSKVELNRVVQEAKSQLAMMDR